MPIKSLNLFTTVAIFTLALPMATYASTEQNTGKPSSFVSSYNTADDWLVLSESLIQRDSPQALDRFDEILQQYPKNTAILEQDFMFSLTEGYIARAIRRGEAYMNALSPEDKAGENVKYIQERASLIVLLKAVEHLKKDQNDGKINSFLDEAVISNDISFIAASIMRIYLAPSQKEREKMLEQLSKAFPDLLSNYIKLQYAYASNDATEAWRLLKENTELLTLIEANDVRELVEVFLQNNEKEKAQEIQISWVKSASNRSFFTIKTADNLSQANIQQKIAQSFMILGRIYSSAFSENPNFRNQLAFHMAQYLDENSPVIDYNLARSYLALNNFKKAQEILTPLLNKAPVSARARFDYAITLEREEKFEQALDIYKQLETEFPQDISVLESQAEIYRHLSAFEAAIPLLDKAIALAKKQYGATDEDAAQPASPIPAQALYLVFSRGICYERLNHWEKAEKDLLWAVQHAPENPIILNYLAYSWVDRGENLDEAEKMLKLAIDKFPNDGNIVDSLGWLYFRQNNLDEAIKWLDKAANLEPAQGEILDHLGDALWWNGRKREALYAWQRVLDVDPSSDAQKRAQHKLKTQKPIQIPSRPRIDIPLSAPSPKEATANKSE